MLTYAEFMENEPESFESLLSFGYVELMEKISGFMTKIIADETPDCVILVQRKGERIFRDLFHHHAILDDDVLMIGDSEVELVNPEFRNILILDDSIKTGKKVCRVLNHVRSRCPCAKVTVTTLISNSETVARICAEYKPRFMAMEMYKDIEEQDSHSDFIFFLTNASGIRYGTGYPGLEFMAGCTDFRKMSDFVRGIITNTFAENTAWCQKNQYKDAVKVTFNLPSYHDDGVCTSDQKIFLFMDMGLKGMLVRIEFLINPSEDSIHDLEDASKVSDYAERTLGEKLEKVRSEVSRGLRDRGCLIGEPRIRRPSESRLP